MIENAAKFYELYRQDEKLRRRIAQEESLYPGSLEIRDAVVTEIVLPIAEELGLPFTLLDLKVYETKLKAQRRPDVELSEEELAEQDEGDSYFLLDRGWSYDGDVFQSGGAED